MSPFGIVRHGHTRHTHSSASHSSPRPPHWPPGPFSSTWGIWLLGSLLLVGTALGGQPEATVERDATDAELSRGDAVGPLAALTSRDDPTSALAKATRATQKPVDEAVRARIQESYGKLPLRFEANRGQTDAEVKFLSRGNGYSLFLTPTESVVTLSQPKSKPVEAESKPDKELAKDETIKASTSDKPGRLNEVQAEADPEKRETAVIRMQMLGANPSPAVAGENQLPGTTNYFRGNDPTQWRTGVTNYKKVRYEEVYPGIDLVYYGNQQKLEYDFVVQPGADPKAIALQFSGADTLSLDDEGNLVLDTPAGLVIQQAPVIYQVKEGIREPVAGGYVLEEDNRVAFEVAAYDHEKTLIIDPVLAYSTFLGAYDTDEAYDIAVDTTGNAYVVGRTYASDFPTTAGAYDASYNGGSYDVFITKLNADGSALVYSTFLGGDGIDYGADLAVDSSGHAYVMGYTYPDSNGFPTTAGAYDTSYNGTYDIFITKLNTTGSALIYSTFLGGGGIEYDGGLAIDASGHAYVSGRTGSTTFPTTSGAYDTSRNGDFDTFITKLNAAGSALVYSTYLGGSNFDYGDGVAVDASGQVYVTGQTLSSDFPTTSGAYKTSYSGGTEAFITKLNAAGSALIYSTYLGGSGGDSGSDLAVDASGHAYVTGYTSSTDFPTTAGSFKTSHNGNGTDAFITKLNTAGSALVYSTYLGGSTNDHGSAIAVDTSGYAYVTGYTKSTDFPTTAGAYDNSFNDSFNSDAFITKVNVAGSALNYSTYLGGGTTDEGRAIALDTSGHAYVTGSTSSSDFPSTAGAYDTDYNGRYAADAFISKFVFDTSPALQSLTVAPATATIDVGATQLFTVTGTYSDSSTAPLTLEATAVAAGQAHTCALDDNGAVTCWGDNTDGQTTVPTNLVATGLAAGDTHTCAFDADGAVTCWGDNTDNKTTVPTHSDGSALVATALVAGANHTCALEADGVVTCWGDTTWGQTTVPTDLVAVDLAAGDAHTCAIKNCDGTVTCWGDNTNGQTTVPAGLVPTRLVAGSNHTCAFDATGAVSCWGDNIFGQTTVPTHSDGSALVATALAAGDGHTCALENDGAITCWGDDNDGQATVPTYPDGSPLAATALTAGGNHTCAITDKHMVTCWGDDTDAQSTAPPSTAIIWTSSDTAVATIAAAGLASGLSTGTTTITAAVETFSDSATLNVNAVDNVNPTVTINQADGQADPTNQTPIDFTVVFNEPVTGFTGTDVTLTGTAGATTATSTPTEGTTYTVTVSGMTQDGTVIATVPPSAANDLAGNPNEASTSTDNEVIYDTTAPVLDTATVNGTSLALAYTEVNGLDTTSVPATTDFTVSNSGAGQTVSHVAVSGAAVTLTVTPGVAHGDTVTVTYTVGTNPIQDLAGNDAAALSAHAVTNQTPDTTAPTVTLTTPTAGATVTDGLLVVAAARDAGGIATVTFTVTASDGTQVWTSTTSTAPYNAHWDLILPDGTTTATPGTYTVSAEGKDQAGNATTVTAPITGAGGADDGGGAAGDGECRGDGHAGLYGPGDLRGRDDREPAGPDGAAVGDGRVGRGSPYVRREPSWGPDLLGG